MCHSLCQMKLERAACGLCNNYWPKWTGVCLCAFRRSARMQCLWREPLGPLISARVNLVSRSKTHLHLGCTSSKLQLLHKCPYGLRWKMNTWLIVSPPLTVNVLLWHCTIQTMTHRMFPEGETANHTQENASILCFLSLRELLAAIVFFVIQWFWSLWFSRGSSLWIHWSKWSVHLSGLTI